MNGRRARWLWGVAAALVVGCGGQVVFVEDGGAGDDADADGNDDGSDDGSNASGGSVGSTVSAAMVSTAAGDPDVIPTIGEVKLGANCKPEVGPDPIVGSLVVSYANTGTGTGGLVLTRAEVIFATPTEGWVFPINLEPTSSGAVSAGTVIQVEHQKVATPGESSFVCSLCSIEGVVAVYFQDDQGIETSADATFSLSCAF